MAQMDLMAAERQAAILDRVRRDGRVLASELAIELQAGEPLPAESEVAAAKNREHLSQLGDGFIPDRRISLERNLFSVGTIDYQAGGNYVQNGSITIA